MSEAEILVIGDQPVFEKDSGYEVSAALLHERDVFVIDIAAVFDGIDSGENCVFDSERTMRMVCDFAAEAGRGVDDGLHFFRAELLERGIVAFRKHAAGGHKLD